jgi:hypothetical protein
MRLDSFETPSHVDRHLHHDVGLRQAHVQGPLCAPALNVHPSHG